MRPWVVVLVIACAAPMRGAAHEALPAESGLSFYAVRSSAGAVRLTRYSLSTTRVVERSHLALRPLLPVDAESGHIVDVRLSPGGRWLAVGVERVAGRSLSILDLRRNRIALRLDEPARAYGPWFAWHGEANLCFFRTTGRRPDGAPLNTVYSLAAPFTAPAKRVTERPSAHIPFLEPTPAERRLRSGATRRLSISGLLVPFLGGHMGTPVGGWERYLDGRSAGVSEDGRTIVAFARRLGEDNAVYLLRAADHWRPERLSMPDAVWLTRIWRGWAVVGEADLTKRPTGEPVPATFALAPKRLRFTWLGDNRRSFSIPADFFVPAPP